MEMPIVNVSFLSSSIGGFSVDATIRESHEQQVEITENPIEFGAPVNDHQYLKAKTLDIEVVISDKTMGELYDRQFGEKGSNRNGEAYKKFIALAASGEPFDIQTRLLLYQDMLINSVSTITELTSVGAQSFNVSFREANIVYTEAVNYTKPKKPAAHIKAKAAHKTTMGKVQLQDTTPPQERQVSVLLGMKNGTPYKGFEKYFPNLDISKMKI